MEFKHIGLLCFGFIAIVILLQSGAETPSPKASAPQLQMDPNTQPRLEARQGRSDSAGSNESNSGSVVLQRQNDGHFYARANVNGGTIRFLVDTGASAIALTGDDARAIGLDWSDDELRKIGRGASGDVFGKPVMLSKVSIGSVSAINVQAAIIPKGLDVSLLGQSFLEKVDNVNIANGKMILK